MGPSPKSIAEACCSGSRTIPKAGGAALWRSSRIKPGRTFWGIPRNEPTRALLPRRSAGLLGATFAAGFATGEGVSARPELALAQPERSSQPEPQAEAPAPAIRQVGYLDVVDRSSGEQPAGRLPIVDGPGVDGRWLGDQTPKIPEYLRAQWERKGYQVAEHRRIVSVVLQDGRQVAVPLDEVELEYVGQQPN